MGQPLVSVVVPVYREGPLLRDTIESVMEQTFKEFEIILVDNNADEISIAILSEYVRKFPNVIRVISQKIQGAPSARNKGILESRGKYIAMLEGDDILYPKRLEKQVEAFEKEKGDISLLSSRFDFVDWSNNKILSKGIEEKNFWMESLKLQGIFRSHPSTWFFDRQKAIDLGLFNEAFNPRLVEDDEFNFRMFLEGRLLCLQESLVRVRLPSKEYKIIKDSQASSVNVLSKLNLFFDILKNRLSEKKEILYDKKGFSKIRSQWLREQGVGFLSYENGKKIGRKFLLDALKEDIGDYKNWKLYFRSFYKNFKSDTQINLSDKDVKYLFENIFFNKDV